MNIINAILLGVIQGLTEFLPVSSSGHLVLFQKIFGISEPALLFDTMLHVGTLAAVFVVLWKDIWAIARKLNQPLTAYVVIGTIPAVVFALLLKDPLAKAFATGRFLGLCFLITAVLLATAELLAKRAASGNSPARGVKGMRWPDALVIGVMQAVAIIPGVSRSGATLSGAISRGLDRDFAARFSFLLSIPAILGALVLQLKDLLQGGDSAAGAITGGLGAAAIIAGTASAAIVGFFAMRFMLKIVRERSLRGFAVYTAVLGLLVLLDQFAIHLIF